jgi:hypothetical protein
MVYVRWRDAGHQHEEYRIEDIELIELEEVGWLVGEDDECIKLTMEIGRDDNDPEFARLWLAVPKVNIVEQTPLQIKRRSCRKRTQPEEPQK